MRISDWSSDVCSSDLPADLHLRTVYVSKALHALHACAGPSARRGGSMRRTLCVLVIGAAVGQIAGVHGHSPEHGPAAIRRRTTRDSCRGCAATLRREDRKSVVTGTMVSARVDIGGLRFIQA